MISTDAEDRIARYYFHRYLPENIMMELEEKLLPYYLMDEEPSDDEMVKLAIDIIDSMLEK